jgi:hypothetical protein
MNVDPEIPMWYHLSCIGPGFQAAEAWVLIIMQVASSVRKCTAVPDQGKKPNK